MGRTARTISSLTACGVCLVGAVGAIAIAAPAQGGARTHGASHNRACRAPTHARRSHSGRDRRCRRPPHRVAARVPRPAAGIPGPVLPAAEGPAGTTVPGAPAPAAPGSGSTSQTTESAPPAPPSVPRIQVIAIEYGLTLSRTTVPAGKVLVEFVNHGQDEHNLNFLAGEGQLAGSFADTAANGVSEEAIVLRAGTYSLFCSLPQHEQKGMRATLVVQ